MTTLLRWLASFDWLVYLVCGAGALIYLAQALGAQREHRLAQFTLERETAVTKGVRAGSMMFLCLAVAAAVLGITRLVIPQLPESEGAVALGPTMAAGLETLTPTAALTNTLETAASTPGTALEPLPAPTAAPVDTAPATATPPGAATVNPAGVLDTPVPTPEPTLEPTATSPPPLITSGGCPYPNVQIAYPADGSTVSGVVEVGGTATVDEFGYYKFEVRFPGAAGQNFIADYREPVVSGVLGQWDVSNPILYPPGGPYILYVTAVDIYGAAFPCSIVVNIAAP